MVRVWRRLDWRYEPAYGWNAINCILHSSSENVYMPQRHIRTAAPRMVNVSPASFKSTFQVRKRRLATYDTEGRNTAVEFDAQSAVETDRCYKRYYPLTHLRSLRPARGPRSPRFDRQSAGRDQAARTNGRFAIVGEPQSHDLQWVPESSGLPTNNPAR